VLRALKALQEQPDQLGPQVTPVLQELRAEKDHLALQVQRVLKVLRERLVRQALQVTRAPQELRAEKDHLVLWVQQVLKVLRVLRAPLVRRDRKVQ
jgi:hypothetical protein